MQLMNLDFLLMYKSLRRAPQASWSLTAAAHTRPPPAKPNCSCEYVLCTQPLLCDGMVACPCRVPRECPAEIDALIGACVASNPADRPTAKQVVQRILQSPAGPPSLNAGAQESLSSKSDG